MITLRDVTLARAGRVLLEGVSLTLHARNRVGVVGANGSGKSSLFALLSGELHAEAGDVDLPPGLTIASVRQETPALACTALDYVLDGDTRLRETERALAAAEAAHDGHALAELHERYRELDGYTARARAATLLDGLSFAPTDIERPVAEFSGGWRMRLNLAQALMCRADLLLLDEPTNHLDLDAVIWLEQWLRAYPGTLLVISHDREFLDGVVDSIAHLSANRLRLYTGDFSAFEVARATQLAQQQAAHARYQREVARLTGFIERFRAKATKARQAQSRVKALERMQVVEAAHADSPFSFRFPAPDQCPDPLLALDQVSVGYGSGPEAVAILRNIKLTLRPQARIGLLGRNGAGKSTLIKLLAGSLAPLSGKCQPARDLAVGYFAQHQLEHLRPDDTPLQHFVRLEPRTREQELRDFLGTFGFFGDQATSPVGVLSGGEKARLALAHIVREKPHLLLLDEPTNHLDMEMRHALELALQDFEGAVVLVSHDRHLLRTVCDDLLLVADGRVAPFDGDVDGYRDWLARQVRAPVATENAAAASAGNAEPDRRARKRQEAEARQRLAQLTKPLKARVAKAEEAMARIGKELADLDAALSHPDAYADGNRERLQGQVRRQGELRAEQARVEEDWIEAQSELEAAEADALN